MVLLPPPHAAASVTVSIRSSPSAQSLRRLSNRTVKAHPKVPNRNHTANRPPAGSYSFIALNSAVSSAASMVRVELSPAPTDTGVSRHVGVGTGPVTEQLREIIPEKPPCDCSAN